MSLLTLKHYSKFLLCSGLKFSTALTKMYAMSLDLLAMFSQNVDFWNQKTVHFCRNKMITLEVYSRIDIKIYAFY